MLAQFASLAPSDPFVAEPQTADAFVPMSLYRWHMHQRLSSSVYNVCVCVYVGFGRFPIVAVIRGVFDMSQFPHLGMTCPQPGNTEQTNCAQACVCVCVIDTERERGVFCSQS